jgi:Icc-related predicted phosphoesterase
MKVLVFTDIHGNTEQFQFITSEIESAELIILAGDITNFGRQRELHQILRILMPYRIKIIAVHGNCDYPEVLQELQANRISMHGAVSTIDGIQFLGLGGSVPCPGHTPSEYSEDNLESILENAQIHLDQDSDFILVSHQPPLDTVTDTIYSGQHVGSRAVRTFIEKYQPVACFTGHIHEGIGIDRLGRTQIINPGPLRSGYYASFLFQDGIKDLELKQIYTGK